MLVVVLLAMVLFFLGVISTPPAAGDTPTSPSRIPASLFTRVEASTPEPRLRPEARLVETRAEIRGTPAASPSPPAASSAPAKSAAPTARARPATTPRPATFSPPTSVPKGDYSAAILAARQYALATIGSTQFACLDAIVMRESHWNPFDLNPRSGAYGIPQAVPGSKMASAGADWATNPTTQVRWMLGYVHGRYGSACGALQHSNATGWY